MSDKITLVQAEPLSYQIAFGDKREAKAYDVYVGDVHIGVVRNGSRPSYRKVGRLRGGLIGYPAHWSAEPIGGWTGPRRDWREKSRKAAVDTLVAAYLEATA